MRIDVHSRLGAGMMIVTVAAALAVVTGCSGGSKAAAVDAPKARQALETALESWKKGTQPDELKNGSPPMTVQDLDWMNGLKLMDYQIDENIKDEDANLRIPVKLTLKDTKGKEIKKQVRYVVGTSPSVTVFRELF